jgi:hypothetical protein
MKYTKATQQELNAANISDPMYAISHGLRQPDDLLLGCCIAMFDRGFVYVGNMSLSYDSAGEPWIMITDAKNITTFGTQKGLGALRHGPTGETKTSEWGLITGPFKDLLFLIRADYKPWKLPLQEAPAGYGNEYSFINPHTPEELAKEPGLRNAADMEAKITIVDRGFVFLGRTYIGYDPTNRPWVVVRKSRTLADYGDVEIGELRTGPTPKVKHDGWGDVFIPMHAFAHFILADLSAWDTLDPTIPYLQKD